MPAAVAHGYLPANKYIINHDIMNCTAEGVVGNHLYSGRALGMSEPWDIILLHPLLEALMPFISSHYDNIGLSYSKQIIWNLDLSHLGSHIGFEPSVFYFGPHESRYWGDSQWLQTVEFINSKNNFMQLADELGVDVPATDCFDSVNDITDAAIAEFPFPCYLKAAVSVSGVGIYRCETLEELLAAIDKFEKDVPVQLQEEVDTNIFLNLQYRVVDGKAVKLEASEQILDGFAHQGNTVPATHEPWHIVDPMADWLVENGMKGIFAFDVAVVQTERGLRFPAIECNPRFNGASYPTMIAQKLDIPEWTAISLSTSHRDFDQLDLSDIEYDHNKGEGVIMVNWGTILEGKLVFLLAGAEEYRDELAVELKARLC